VIASERIGSIGSHRLDDHEYIAKCQARRDSAAKPQPTRELGASRSCAGIEGRPVVGAVAAEGAGSLFSCG
jgi:hypothetical protein